jgi:hypothetical protein
VSFPETGISEFVFGVGKGEGPFAFEGDVFGRSMVRITRCGFSVEFSVSITNSGSELNVP